MIDANVLAEYDLSGNLNAEYIYGLRGMIAKVEPDEGYYFYYKDHLGSTRQLSQNAQTNDYYPYGESMEESGTETQYRFSGKELDNYTGLYDFGRRSLLSAIGRFIIPDRFADMYPLLTPYQYAANNPIRFIDMGGDSIENVDKDKYDEMMENMSESDKEIYNKYLNSETVYQFDDIYNGYNVLTEARKYIDELEYASNTNDLESSVDCSGFVQAVLKKLKYTTDKWKWGTNYIFNRESGKIKANGLKWAEEPSIWGDIAIWLPSDKKKGGHMGFFDPNPISLAPGKGGKNYTGYILSARESYGKVHYGKSSWFNKDKSAYVFRVKK